MKVRNLIASGSLVAASVAQFGFVAGAVVVPAQAQAADGCKVLLCLAGNWSRIAQCIPPVREFFRDTLFGRPFPTCGMAGPTGAEVGAASTRANMVPVTEEVCPPMYRMYYEGESGTFYGGCTYGYMVQVTINGGVWNKVFFDAAGNTSTWYSDAARSALSGSIGLDPRFDTDYAAWLAVQPPPPPPSNDYGGGA